MGYKTKNYTEITRTSDADGYSTISDASPLGKAIIGKRIGDFAEFTVKGKTNRFKILSVVNNE